MTTLQLIYNIPDEGDSITLEFTGGIINYIDWGDGNVDINPTPPYSHSYVSIEPHITVQVSGVNVINFNVNSSPYLTKCISFGDIGLTNFMSTFSDATNLFSVPDSLPSNIITDLNKMFYRAISFNQPLNNWNVSNVTDMGAMFYEAAIFNQPLNYWNVSNVTNMGAMFSGATSFNQDISGWNVSNVTNMNGMFGRLPFFNQPLNNWNVSNVTEMINMFYGATSFNQDISSWDISNVTNMDSMLNGTILSIDNYNKLLNVWSKLTTLQTNVSFGTSGLIYTSSGVSGRNVLTQTPNNWIISGDAFLEPDIVYVNQSFSLTCNNSLVLVGGDIYQLYLYLNDITNPFSSTVIYDGVSGTLLFNNLNYSSTGTITLLLCDNTTNTFVTRYNVTIVTSPTPTPTPTPTPESDYNPPYYRPNLQPMSNLGNYNRYNGAASIGSRTKFGNASRMYSYANATNQVQSLKNQFSFAIFGIKK